jgi:hypothetical protein
VVRGLLESEGIQASLADEHQIWANWQMSQVFGGVRLQVPASQHQHALEILAAHRNGDYKAALESELDLPADVCPKCASSDIRTLRSASSRLVVIASFIFAGVFFPPATGKKLCNTCGARFGSPVETDIDSNRR